jgi:hypothetical protein
MNKGSGNWSGNSTEEPESRRGEEGRMDRKGKEEKWEKLGVERETWTMEIRD